MGLWRERDSWDRDSMTWGIFKELDRCVLGLELLLEVRYAGRPDKVGDWDIYCFWPCTKICCVSRG